MKQTHNLSLLVTSILVALYPIARDGVNYDAGDLLEVPKTDAKFLQMAKCVREPTASELEHWEELQDEPSTLPPVTMVPPQNAISDNHVFKQDKLDEDDVVIGTAVEVETEAVENNISAEIEPQPTLEPQPMPLDINTTDATNTTNAIHDNNEALEVAAVNPYADWLKKDLNIELDKRGIEHDAGARNDVLEALLVANDASKVK